MVTRTRPRIRTAGTDTRTDRPATVSPRPAAVGDGADAAGGAGAVAAARRPPPEQVLAVPADYSRRGVIGHMRHAVQPGLEDLALARQPILDRQRGLIGYELLFRRAGETAAAVGDGLSASAQVVNNAFAEMGLARS